MFLSRVAVEGFKSFADRAQLELGPGITALVGPNGAGKSNLVDAIRWALGEQNPRLLRAARMEDLLFAGAGGRRPASMAEVTLQLADPSGAGGSHEVSVTRRLFRSGESEYRLDGMPCRLRDIEARMKALGLGLEGAWHVEQGRIEAFMESPAQERRRWVEEAIGLGRYRLERAETIRELAVVDQDLRQLHVLVGELEERLPALEMAARRSEQARLLSAEVHDLEVAVALERLARLRAAHEQARGERAQAEAARAAAEALEGRLAEGAREQLVVHERLRSALVRWEERVARAQAREEGVRQRLLERERRARSAAAAALEQRERRAELRARLRAARRLLDRGALERLEDGWRAAQAQLESVEARWGATAQALQERQQRELERGALVLERERLAAHLKALGEPAPADAGAVARLSAELAAARSELRTVDEASEGARRRVDAQVARIEALGHAGPPERAATAQILRAARAGRLEGVLGRVGNLLAARSSDHEEAVAQALGGAVDHVVVRSEADARAAIRWLRSARGGRTTLLPLDILRPPPALRPPAVSGLVDVAVRLVDVEPGMEPVALLLLGRVLVAVDLAAAVAIGRALGMRARVVTLEGDVLHPGGAMTGGGGGERGERLRSLRQALARERAELQLLLARRGELQARVAETERALRAAEDRLAAARRRDELARAHAAVEDRLAALGPEEELPLDVTEVAEARSRERAARARLEAGRQAVEHARQVAREILAERRLMARAARDARLEADGADPAELARLGEILREARGARDEARRLAGRVETLALALERVRVGVREAKHREAERIARLEGRLGELDAALADARHRVAEELGADPDEPLRPVRPGDEARLERLRKRLAAMGGTSPFAEAEYAQVHGRHAAARAQERDLLGAKDALLRTLAEVDRQAHERLVTAVERLNQAFDTAFRTLFGGGTARVWIDEAGMQAQVQAPGKRTRLMSLLSGGERSLTGMALLFALIEVFASPFQLLDEVEAPLDEANVERVARYLRERRDRQWILVTHQRASMEQADVLYGVTMPEPGVSRLYTLRLEEEARHAQVE